jgi:hypothetical protein
MILPAFKKKHLTLTEPDTAGCITNENAGSRSLPRSVQHQRCTSKERENPGPTENLPPPRTLHGPGLESDWNLGWCRAGLQTTAWLDFSRSWLVCINSKTEQRRWCRSQTSDKNLSFVMSCHVIRNFLMSCQRFKKIRKTFLQE